MEKKSVKLNIFDLIPGAFLFFLISRDSGKYENGNSVLSICTKKAKIHSHGE